MKRLLEIMKQYNIWVLNISLRLRKILNWAYLISTIFPQNMSKTRFQRHL